MKTPLSVLFTLAATITVLPAYTVDFNQPDDLSNNFAIALFNDGRAANLPAVNSTSGGLNNSGAVVGTEHLNTQALIYTRGFTLQEGSTYTVSTYFKGIAYNGVGFTTGIAPTMEFLPEISISYIGSEADDLYITNYTTADEAW